MWLIAPQKFGMVKKTPRSTGAKSRLQVEAISMNSGYIQHISKFARGEKAYRNIRWCYQTVNERMIRGAFVIEYFAACLYIG